MAAITPIDPGWLARTFTEYELLPDLLAMPGTADAENPPESWAAFLSETGANTEHLEEEAEPPEEDLPDWLASDVWHLVRQLQLVDKDGLTPAGQHIAAIAGTPFTARSHDQLHELQKILAVRIRACHLGQGDAGITALLQKGAGILAKTEHIWAAYCPGLLLVEFETLIQLAMTDPDRAETLCDEELALNRDYAMHPYGEPSPDRPPLHNMLDHADAVTHFYFDRSSLLPAGFEPDIGASRATAMLYTFANLLKEVYPAGAVQCMAPPAN